MERGFNGKVDGCEEIKLIEDAKTNPAAFGKIFELYHRKIFRYAARLTSNADAAADIAAEVFYKALKAIPKYKHSGVPFSAWLYRIATNECNTYFRKGRYAPASFDAAIESGAIKEPVSSRDVEKEMEEAQALLDNEKDYVRAVRLMAGLKPLYREVLALRFMEGKKIGEIAQILGKKEGTIKSLISRGIAMIKRNQKAGPAL